MAGAPSPAREGHDLMTWVTVQSHDIGTLFLGIYALEKVFGVEAGCNLFLRSRTRASRSRRCVVVLESVARAVTNGGSVIELED